MATERLLEADRADPLQPATLALLQGDNRHAWQSLQQAWPALTSDAERRSWQGMLAALSAQHCGKDFPLTLPDGVSELRLELIQRDAPLLRDYRVQLTGEGAITAAELIDPAGRDRLAGAQWEAEENSGVRVVGADLPTPLPAGLYLLRLAVAGKDWQVALPLPAVQDLDWLSRSPLAVANPPRQSRFLYAALARSGCAGPSAIFPALVEPSASRWQGGLACRHARQLAHPFAGADQPAWPAGVAAESQSGGAGGVMPGD
ncbi:DUF2861 family protein [Aeromonas veronii]|uniref:DUF2861 family protein n=1 Tax=Aeromonas veronii TaxID=654 RepID=UPI0024439628|nr:DUF2861 family protein [Aeromonas veronii]